MGCMLCCYKTKIAEPNDDKDSTPLVEKRKLRALCLHGKGANAELILLQLHNLETTQLIDHIVIPGRVPGKAFDGSDQKGYFDWYSEDKSPREAAKELLSEIVKNHLPIDMVIGFSQGAAIASILIQGIESMDDSLKISLPKYLLLLNGTCSDAVTSAAEDSIAAGNIRRFPIKTPSLHIQGRTDMYYNESIELQNMFLNPTIIPHEYGHEVTKEIGDKIKPAIHEWLRSL